MFFSCSLPESCNLFSYIKQHADFPFFIPAPPSLFCKAFKKYNQERRRRLLWSHFYYPPAPFSDHFTFSLTILESFHRERQVTAFLKELPPCLVCVKTRGTLQTPQRRRSAGRWGGTLPWHRVFVYTKVNGDKTIQWRKGPRKQPQTCRYLCATLFWEDVSQQEELQGRTPDIISMAVWCRLHWGWKRWLEMEAWIENWRRCLSQRESSPEI